MGTTAWFATREDIRSALDASDAARSDAQLDRALDAASRAVVGLCHREFVPTLATKVFDWPSDQTPRSWRLWLNQHDLISATQILSAGTAVPDTDYYLEPTNSGPPYTHVVTRLDKPSAWSAGDTWQHAISITGWWGYSDAQAPAGALAAAVSDTSGTSVTVTDSSAVGVGHILTCGTERMTVTGKRLVDTGQTLQTPITDLNNETLIEVTDGAAFHEGEYIVLGAEWMEITAITGNTLIVTRGVNGSVLDTHSGTAIWAPRLLTVARAAAGTTAATATSGTVLTRWAPPGLVHTLCVAEAQNWLLNEQAGWLRTTGSSTGSGGREATLDALKDLREQCYTEHGRKARIRAV